MNTECVAAVKIKIDEGGERGFAQTTMQWFWMS